MGRNIKGLDGVRALACLWVVAHHVFHLLPLDARPKGHLTWVLLRGDRGVAVFFVLSGMLLSYPLLEAFREGRRPRWDIYIVRRLGRIVPGYYLCLVACALLSPWWGSSPGITNVMLSFAFVNSFFPRFYFPIATNQPLWSIGVEVTFYWLLPLFMMAAYRCRSLFQVRLLWLLVVAGLTIGNGVLINRYFPSLNGVSTLPSDWSLGSEWAIVKNPIALFAHFLMGFLAADVLLELRRNQGITQPGQAGILMPNAYDVAACLCCALVFVFDVTVIIPMAWRLSGLLHTTYDFPFLHLIVATLLVTLPLSRYVGKALDNPFFRTTATLSFGIYLWHDFIIFLLKNSGTPLGHPEAFTQFVPSLAAVLAISYVVAALSYLLVERPVLRKAHAYGRAARGVRR